MYDPETDTVTARGFCKDLLKQQLAVLRLQSKRIFLPQISDDPMRGGMSERMTTASDLLQLLMFLRANECTYRHNGLSHASPCKQK